MESFRRIVAHALLGRAGSATRRRSAERWRFGVRQCHLQAAGAGRPCLHQRGDGLAEARHRRMHGGKLMQPAVRWCEAAAWMN